MQYNIVIQGKGSPLSLMDLNAKELIVFLTDPTAAATNIAISTGYVSFLNHIDHSFGLTFWKLQGCARKVNCGRVMLCVHMKPVLSGRNL